MYLPRLSFFLPMFRVAKSPTTRHERGVRSEDGSRPVIGSGRRLPETREGCLF
ncbi:hypothetical protein HanRHA438_Chr06g0252691 [Helianthus annuus]|nr:hypothetical protein HanIR_Chr06g0261831 [Helianthus annuus]KAJ0910473.1 hypothetical protein HanRHA438_Chr06g0252691 [Helianthus annuus]